MGYELVVQSLAPREWKEIPEAVQAVQGEYGKLRKRTAWDESRVSEKRDIIARHKERCRRENNPDLSGPLFGRIAPLCGVKNSEVAHLRRYKGRVVFLGDWILDEFGQQYEFPDQGSGASFMAASRMLDAISLLDDCSGQQSDAPQAYTQTTFGFGIENMRETWIRLPQDAWPESW